MNIKTGSFTNKQLVEKTKDLLARERECTVEIIILLSTIWARKFFFPKYCDFSEFCIKELGMTKNQAWQRTQIAKCIRYFPEFLDLIRSGETSMTNVRLAASKVTKANFSVISEGIKGKSKREAQLFLSSVTPEGKINEIEARMEIRVDAPKSVILKLERAKEVLSAKGKNVNTLEAIDQALEALLDRKDPLRKAERAQAKEKARARSSINFSSTSENHEKNIFEAKTLYKQQTQITRSRYIPSKVKHQVFLRDEGRCSHVGEDGKRCPERSMLEIDHRQMFCRGGENNIVNLALLCRRHNQNAARRELGDAYMDSWRKNRQVLFRNSENLGKPDDPLF